MINANELRIGNWVQHDFVKKPQQITQVMNFHACIDHVGCPLENLLPIPLTYDIMGKTGFNKHLDKKSPYWFLNGLRYNMETRCLTIVRHCDKAGESQAGWCGGSIGDCISITSLHQLQNLYFALTGTELEYKPK